MRGVVSLAAALSIPVQLDNGTAFPHRNLILFVTFIVILTTLLVQGLTLPYLLRKLVLPAYDDYLPEDKAEDVIKRGLAKNAIKHLTENYPDHLANHPLLQQMVDKWNSKINDELDPQIPAESKKIYLEVIDEQRKWLINRNNVDGHIDEDIIRKHLRQLDLEEEKFKII